MDDRSISNWSATGELDPALRIRSAVPYPIDEQHKIGGPIRSRTEIGALEERGPFRLDDGTKIKLSQPGCAHPGISTQRWDSAANYGDQRAFRKINLNWCAARDLNPHPYFRTSF